MTVIFQTGYSLPSGDEDLTHARIAHANNWYAGGTIAASSAETGYFASAPDNSLTYEYWKPSSLPATWETDLGSAREVDYCAIAAHNMGSNGNTLQVQYWNGSSWSGVIPSTAITTEEPIFCIFAPQTRQRWRIQVSNGTAPTIGVIRFGKALQMPRPMSGGHQPLALGRETVSRANISETGEILGRSVLRRSLKSSYSWNIIENSWIDANWPDFQRAAEAEPFFTAWRPVDDSGVGYGMADEVPKATYTGQAGFMRASLAMTARSWE